MTTKKVVMKILIYMIWLLVCCVFLLHFLLCFICLDDGWELPMDIVDDRIGQREAPQDDDEFWAENNCVRVLLYRIEVECHQPIVLPIGPNVRYSFLVCYFYCLCVAVRSHNI